MGLVGGGVGTGTFGVTIMILVGGISVVMG